MSTFPTPWTVDNNNIVDATGCSVADVNAWHDEQIEEQILRAVNNHDALVAALRKLTNFAAPAGADSCGQAMVKMRAAAIEQARAVLAAAGAA